jgi:3-oxoacyl-[acyl-carrier protein] reductase
LAESGLSGKGWVLDVSDPVSIEALMNALIDHHGSPAVLINNAGITRDNLLLRMKDDEWNAIIQTNLNSVFRLSKACLKGMMKARQGRIVNITSVVGATGNPGQTNYAAAKAGVIGFTKSLAREVGSRNITVNAVAPGFIDTDMTRALSDEQKGSLLGNIPLGRLGSVDEVAGAVVFLCSDAAAYITGETMHVNGGMYMA